MLNLESGTYAGYCGGAICNVQLNSSRVNDVNEMALLLSTLYSFLIGKNGAMGQCHHEWEINNI